MTTKYARTVGGHSIQVNLDDESPYGGDQDARCLGCGTCFGAADHPVGHLGRAVIAWANEHAGICRFTP